MAEEKKSYYAIITADVRYDKSLTPNAKLLYGEITALCNEKGYCWATNKYFSELYEVSKETISRWISQLKKKGYINIQTKYKEGTKQIINRYIRISQGGIDENVIRPIDENVKDNTTLFNNTINNTVQRPQKKDSNTNKKKKSFPPTPEEVQKYLDEKNIKSFTGEKFVNHYETIGWKKKGGIQMVKWKTAANNWNINNKEKLDKEKKKEKSYPML